MARTVTLSAAAVLALAGGAGWLVGSSALAPGVGTLVLAVGIGVTAYLVVSGSRGAADHPMERWRSRRLLRLAVVGVVAVIGGGAVLGLTAYGELATPFGFAVAGALLLPASSLLRDRLYLVLGAALVLLAVTGGVLALNSAGELYPRGLVGLGAGALLWLAAAHRAGLLARGRARF